MKEILLFILCVWPICFRVFPHDYMFKHLEVKDGLSNNQVNAIYKDSNRFMWFGTASGLNRYDGYNIKIYRTPSVYTVARRMTKHLCWTITLKTFRKMRPEICGCVRERAIPFIVQIPTLSTAIWKIGWRISA